MGHCASCEAHWVHSMRWAQGIKTASDSRSRHTRHKLSSLISWRILLKLFSSLCRSAYSLSNVSCPLILASFADASIGTVAAELLVLVKLHDDGIIAFAKDWCWGLDPTDTAWLGKYWDWEANPNTAEPAECVGVVVDVWQPADCLCTRRGWEGLNDWVKVFWGISCLLLAINACGENWVLLACSRALKKGGCTGVKLLGNGGDCWRSTCSVKKNVSCSDKIIKIATIVQMNQY